jgi:hypothetical protein
MENTCSVHCFLWKKYKEKCPNYSEGWWTPKGKDEKPVLIKDCSTKRTMLMVQELSNRLTGIEKSTEQLRNAFIRSEESNKNIFKLMAGMADVIADHERVVKEIKDRTGEIISLKPLEIKESASG